MVVDFLKTADDLPARPDNLPYFNIIILIVLWYSVVRIFKK